MARKNGDSNNDDVIIEFRQVGNAVKVSAMDPRTLTEVSIVGPLTATKDTLTRNVLRKLEYVLAKRRKR
ncbi:MAG: hypothetical protein ACE5H8_01245 [Alphaproteobacteria bacterium]